MLCLLVKEERYLSYIDEGYNIAMVLPNTSEICVLVSVNELVSVYLYIQ